MFDGKSTTDRAGGTATRSEPPAHPGLLRSLAHRLAGDEAELPIEGHLPSFDGATEWLNSEPLTPQGLRGRVVLVDFWTYTCINWLRTLPYIRAWDVKYRDVGLTVIGVHTPEFGFEQNVFNVIAQSRNFGVEYPIAVDSDYGVWQAFANHFWPALYIADAEGRIRYHHFGEGEHSMAEMVVQQLLLEAGAEGVDRISCPWNPRASRSPRTGGPCDPRQREGHRYGFACFSTGRRPAAPTGSTSTSRATANGTLADQRLYQLIRQPASIGERRFEIEFLDAGAEAYCFTFG